YAKLYDPARLTMRPNWKAAPGVPGPREIAQYYGMVSATDAQVGRLLATLDQLGLREDTIVLFTSDHGDMLGSQGERLKRKPWEESIRVPGILRYPRKIPRGRQSEALFTHVDFAPTLLSLCGVRPPSGIQGADLSPVVLGERDAGPDSAFFQIFGPYQGDGTDDGWRGVRTHRYLYARYQSRPWVLYDLEKDSYEQHNLAGERSAQTALGEMERQLSAWMKRTGDSWDYNWHELVEDKGRLYRHEAFYTVEDYLAWAKKHPGTE
ncbi:MAG TPA: sulfatase/phosphatase domain-containing protein, partial [Bryobacteraceae bacterium]|nr:sulfatase/phosphatase domain-containing protein [Bryobacteraceae bacterium]